ncbi:MAG: DHH family phosphoesterase [Deltaproteobacteria bacterium HGW-Deltaproteobacteria-11]|nr:MAG: DHH family phosphoesterase [Deltaproteobacteria bacterium HGW-Deltaproteobacteria-11]
MIPRIVDIINQNATFLITSHERPDGDALGSELALYHMLSAGGKTAVVYNQDQTPHHYRFLPGADVIVHELPPTETFDAAFILDCSELERVGREAGRIRKIRQIVNIDHHVSNGGFCDAALLDAGASSTGELIYRLAEAMALTLTPEMATNLYAALLTDTGGFCYGNTTRDCLVIAGRLVENGARPQWISENLYENAPLVKIRLLAVVLESLALDLNGKVGSMIVTQENLARTDALQEHTDGFVDLPRTIEGVEISILFSELEENHFKLSLRSKGRFDVERVARKLGGGGHVNAAGCRIRGDIATVKRLALAQIEAID